MKEHSHVVGAVASPTVDAVKTHFESKMASEYWLNIGGKDFRLVGKTIKIGRASDNDIVVDHKSCSRYHALLTIQDGHIILEDLKSRNGIIINGDKLQRGELSDNDHFRIGDLSGVFFIRKKIPLDPAALTGHFSKGIISFARVWQNKFQALDPAKKKKVVAGAILGLGLLLLLITGGRSPLREASLVETADFSSVLLTEVDKRVYERCLETEDLGNFRQAFVCFKKLPASAEVQRALARIQKRQEDLSALRFKEGDQAFKNYYYDIAILKWQEVLLIANDDSEYRMKALASIREAEERKKPK